MQIEYSDEHPSKTEAPRLRILQSGSKVKLERSLQNLKQEWEMVSIDEGMRMERSETQ
jgi:hypothetical protein